MNILVTGASGFIGKSLVKFLLQDASNNVYALVRDPATPLPEGCHPLHMDLSEPFDASVLPYQMDVVIQLVQSPRYREFPDGAIDVFNVNVSSTANLMHWAATVGVRRFVFASTGSVYAAKTGLLTEEDVVTAGSYYAACKLAAENLIRPYATLMSVDVLRIFTPYGPGQKNMLISNMVDSVMQEREITLSGEEGLWLTPVYIGDLCQIVLELIRKPGDGYRVFNLGGNAKVSLKQVVEQIASIAGKAAVIRHDYSKPVVSVAADSSKIYAATGYTPGTDLISGLNSIIHGKQ